MAKKTKIIRVRGKEWTKEAVKSLLQSNPMASIRGMIRIFEYQTQDEVNSNETKWANGVGFNGSDSFLLTIFAKQWIDRKRLSEKQLAIVQRKMPKYAGQLFKIMEIEHGSKEM